MRALYLCAATTVLRNPKFEMSPLDWEVLQWDPSYSWFFSSNCLSIFSLFGNLNRTQNKEKWKLLPEKKSYLNGHNVGQEKPDWSEASQRELSPNSLATVATMDSEISSESRPTPVDENNPFVVNNFSVDTDIDADNNIGVGVADLAQINRFTLKELCK